MGFRNVNRAVNIMSLSGKELKELMKKMSGAGKESGSEEEEGGRMDVDEETEPMKLKVEDAKSGEWL